MKLTRYAALACLSTLVSTPLVYAQQEQALVGEPIAIESSVPQQQERLPAASVAPLPTQTVMASPSLAQADPQSTAPTVERLSIQPGQRLSEALGSWLKSQGIELSWEPSGSLPGRARDVVIESAWQASQIDVPATLTEVLSVFGLQAHLVRSGKDSAQAITSVVVRNATTPRS